MGSEDRIESNPSLGPVIRGTLIPVRLILRKLAWGETEANLMEAHPRLTLEDIQAAREYASVLRADERLRQASRRVFELLDAHQLWHDTGGREGKQANLRGADLRGLELSGAFLENVDLRGADLRGTVLSGARIRCGLEAANLSNAHLEGVIFIDALLRDASLAEAHLAGATFCGCDLTGADLRRAQLFGVTLMCSDFRETNLEGAALPGARHGMPIGELIFNLRFVLPDQDELLGLRFDRANLAGADLRGATLSPACARRRNEPVSFHGANLENVDFADADLDEAEFEGVTAEELRDLSRRSRTGPNLPELLAAHEKWLDSNGQEGRRAELEEADLRGVRLAGANLRRANLRGAHLEGANLTGADLSGADAQGAHFEGARMDRVVADEDDVACFEGAGAFLSGASLSGARLSRANLSGGFLRGARLGNAGLEGADLSGSDLRGADLRNVIGPDASLRHAKLVGADLRSADLESAFADRADCERASFDGSRLSWASLRYTRLSYASLSSAHLNWAHLEHADLTRARLDGAAVRLSTFEGAKLEASRVHRSALLENDSLRSAFASSQQKAYLRLAFSSAEEGKMAIAALERIHRGVAMDSLRVVSGALDRGSQQEATVAGQLGILRALERYLSGAASVPPADADLTLRFEKTAKLFDVPLPALWETLALFGAPGAPIADGWVRVEDSARPAPLSLVEDAVLAALSRDLSFLETARQTGSLRELEVTTSLQRA